MPKECYGSVLLGLITQISPNHIWASPIAINTTQIPSDIPHTPPRHPQDIPRELKVPADTNRHKQTPADANRHIPAATGSVLGCPGLSVCVCWFLLASCVLWSCLGGIWGVYGGCLMVSEWYLWKSEALTCVWRVSGLSVLAVQSHNTILAKPWKAQLFWPDAIEASKYQKVYM